MRGRLQGAVPYVLTLVLALLLSSCTTLPMETPKTSSIPESTPETTFPSVFTDWSKLEPRQSKKPVYMRRYEEFINRLIPANDYGPLIPFPAQFVDGGYMGPLPLYGLVTTRGEIIVDPVFSDVHQISSYDYDSHTTYTLDVLALTLADTSHLCALCALDGSWCTDFIYSNIYTYEQSFVSGIPAVRDTTLVFIDPLTGTETRAVDYSLYMGDADGGSVGSFHLDAKEGWLTLNLYLYCGESNMDWHSEDYESWELPLLFDPQGNLCPLPEGVTRLDRYSDGLILAWGPKEDSYTYKGYVDTTGNWVIPPTLFRAYPFENGAALVFSDGGYHFIDPQGNSLTDPIPCDSAEQYDGYWYLLGYNHDVAAIYGKDHLMVNSPLVGLYQPISFYGDGWIVTQDEQNTLLVQKEQFIQVPLTFGKLSSVTENYLLFSKHLDNIQTVLTITDQTGQALSSIAIDGEIYWAHFVGDGVPCLQINQNATFYYYDLQGKELGAYTGLYENLTSYGNVIATTTENDFSLTALDGTILFYWPYPSND